jgi:hypothetical protein
LRFNTLTILIERMASASIYHGSLLLIPLKLSGHDPHTSHRGYRISPSVWLFRVEVSNRYAALEDLAAEFQSNIIWERIGKNIKISAKGSPRYYELKKHKPWFDQGCSKLVDQRKRAKLQWLQDPN